ncbi:IS66 family transposase zinc-finger binding domain-containing protein [Halomonas sp. M5N1S17]|uniref:IS66 family transposase n=1 Tax=Halomonas alkalisoli TaxID=2907158 RepID=UPI001F3E33C6|nr:IS66 family transposase zinc-finger binding domain-containing protein [Halomonas alkalisoli]MCE9663666.1 IS66 family transposase zinc-finger binding domain-containing protein [Halomonas alkalisoli]
MLKRHTFGQRSEHLNVLQISLLKEVVDAAIAAIEVELEELVTAATLTATQQKPTRKPSPDELPRVEIRQEPESEHCTCGCQRRRIGEEISEKLDYTPGMFTAERHIRGKWFCDHCETLIQAPMPAQVIDKGIPARRRPTVILRLSLAESGTLCQAGPGRQNSMIELISAKSLRPSKALRPVYTSTG